MRFEVCVEERIDLYRNGDEKETVDRGSFIVDAKTGNEALQKVENSEEFKLLEGDVVISGIYCNRSFETYLD